jgi:hypothetical protein
MVKNKTFNLLLHFCFELKAYIIGCWCCLVITVLHDLFFRSERAQNVSVNMVAVAIKILCSVL